MNVAIYFIFSFIIFCIIYIYERVLKNEDISDSIVYSFFLSLFWPLALFAIVFKLLFDLFINGLEKIVEKLRNNNQEN